MNRWMDGYEGQRKPLFLNDRTLKGNTSMHLASQAGMYVCIEWMDTYIDSYGQAYLHREGSSFIHIRSPPYTPNVVLLSIHLFIYLSMYLGHLEVVRLLIEAGALLNEGNKEGSVSLHGACWKVSR